MSKYICYIEETVTYAVTIELPDDTPDDSLEAEIETEADAVFTAGNYRVVANTDRKISSWEPDE